MTCDKIKSQLSFIPRGELAYDDRVLILNHLYNCTQCNNEYQQYLRMFFLIDKYQHTSVPPSILDGFSNQVVEKVENNKFKEVKSKYILLYAAAAILLVAIFFNPFTQNKFITLDESMTKESTISELIAKEKWEAALEKLTIDEVPEELISISFLLSKFSNIDIELANHKLTANFGNNTKEFNELIQMLINYQRYKHNISTTEISNFFKPKLKETS
ncbi:hypothetical protein ACFLSX_01325 [Calditrichota bacterium]